MKLASELEECGVNIIGTSPDSIDLAEDRERFKVLIESLSLKQPLNKTVTTVQEAKESAERHWLPYCCKTLICFGWKSNGNCH